MTENRIVCHASLKALKKLLPTLRTSQWASLLRKPPVPHIAPHRLTATNAQRQVFSSSLYFYASVLPHFFSIIVDIYLVLIFKSSPCACCYFEHFAGMYYVILTIILWLRFHYYHHCAYLLSVQLRHTLAKEYDKCSPMSLWRQESETSWLTPGSCGTPSLAS